MTRTRPLALALALVTAVVACQSIAGIDDEPFVVAASTASDAGGDSATAAPAALACSVFEPAGRPLGIDEGTQRTYVFATRYGRIPSPDPKTGVVFGFNLDNTCTCDPTDPNGTTGSCIAPSDPLERNNCDFPGGVDSSGTRVFDRLRAFQQTGELIHGPEIEFDCGRLGWLLLVSGYNGRPNDPEVEVAPLDSYGIRTPHAGGERVTDCQEPGVGPYPAKWDGTDEWSVRPDTVTRIGGELLPFQNARVGYVADYQLVVDGRRSSLILPIVLAQNVARLSTPVIEAHLVPVDAAGNDIALGPNKEPISPPANFRIDHAIAAGRLAAADLLSAAGSLHIGVSASGDAGYFCNDEVFYPPLKRQLCSAVDLPVSGSDEFKNQPCGAISMTVEFAAFPAKIGIDFAPTPPAAGCGPGWRDDCD